MTHEFTERLLSKGLNPSLSRIGAISFVNTLPIYQGLALRADWSLTYAPPAELNGMMERGQLDVSPVSSAFYLQHQHRFTLLPSLSVSSYGSVDSVLFLSKDPLEALSSVQSPLMVPDDSATSVALLGYLLSQHWKQSVSNRFKTYQAKHYLSAIQRNHCGLVIGDRALMIKYALSQATPIKNPILREIQDAFSGWHVMDLSNGWMSAMKTPVVFAVWIAQNSFAQNHPEALKEIESALCHSRDEFCHQMSWQKQALQLAQSSLPLPEEVLMRYWQHSLDYTWTSEHEKSLAQWSQVLHSSETFNQPVVPV